MEIDNLLKELEALPLPSAAGAAKKTTKRSKAVALKAAAVTAPQETDFDTRLLNLEPAAGGVEMKKESVQSLAEKASRLDKIRVLLAEQAKAEAKYKSLENQIVALIRK